MKRLFVDANILLDALLQRLDDPDEAMELLALGEQRKVELVTTALSIGVVLHVIQPSDAAKKGSRLQAARRTLSDVLACLRVVPVEAAHFMQSAARTFGDLEDGAQYFAAAARGALDGVVTRDKDFKGNAATPIFRAKQAPPHSHQA